jgi:CRISPR-associated protein Cmr3
MTDINQANQKQANHKQVFIEPSDVLLFRDGRPFSAGDGHRARSIFPPTPNTMQGVIRSKVLSDRCGRYETYKNGCNDCEKQSNCTIPDEIGRPAQNGRGSYGNLKIRGAIVAKYEKLKVTSYFSVPADVVEVKEKSEQRDRSKSRLRFLQPLSQKIYGDNDLSDDLQSKLLPLWTSETIPVEGVQGYWNQEELQKYLLQDYQSLSQYTKTDELYIRESRYGIEINNALQTVSEGQLYQTEFIRAKENIGLYVEVDGVSDLGGNLIAIGGENRAAQCHHLDLQKKIDWEKFTQDLKEQLQKADGFKIYFATPTIFDAGWLPNWVSKNDLSGAYHGIQVQLVAASIPRYQTIGGWDVAYNRPKPTNRAIPAGSVYYFTSNAKPSEITKDFHWQNIADEKSDAQIGFGLALVGAWNYLKLSDGEKYAASK